MNTITSLLENPLHKNEVYNSDCGLTMRREKGKAPNGSNFNNFWVLRKNGQYIDHDQFRNDLAERNNCKTVRVD